MDLQSGKVDRISWKPEGAGQSTEGGQSWKLWEGDQPQEKPTSKVSKEVQLKAGELKSNIEAAILMTQQQAGQPA